MKKMKYTTKGILLMSALLIVFVLSLFVGKYPLSFMSVLNKEEIALRVFYTLRLPRSVMAILGGFSLGMVGLVYQNVFHNPLASPDFIGVCSGASAGAAFAILFLPASTFLLTGSAFIGSLMAILLALGLSSLSNNKNRVSIVLSGLAVHSLAQTILMFLKLNADPEKELASIEYWIMGSFNGVTLSQIYMPMAICILGGIALFMLYRHIQMLSLDTQEATMLGMDVTKCRLLILFLATLIVASIVSVCGVISFVGLIAPHCARMLCKNNTITTMLYSGCIGGMVLGIADIFARLGTSELPVSIFTSLIGAPFLLYLLVKKEGYHGF